jgi:adenylate cyclase
VTRPGPRRSLFRRYLVTLFVVVLVPLLASGASDALFTARDLRAMLDALLRTEATAAAARIESFLGGIVGQLGTTVQQPWSADAEAQRRLEALGVLRRVPAIASLAIVDGDGRERLFLSRVDLNRAVGGDRSADPAVIEARTTGVWFGPVTFAGGSEPFMSVAVAGNRRAAGVVVAEVNLKLIWELISAIRVGRTGHAFVVDEPGRLIAHPDMSRVLQGANAATLAAIDSLRAALDTAGDAAVATTGIDDVTIAVAMAPVPGVDWLVLVEQPLAEAFAPIRQALWRTAVLLLLGTALAAALAYWLAKSLVGPIRLLEEGTERLGAGQLEHRIRIATGDELEALAERFNRMAAEIALSQQRRARIERLRRFLAPQVAELVEQAGDETVLAAQQAEVVVVFGDLRGFTAFAAGTDPETIMRLLATFHDALGTVVTRHEATLTGFSGDGFMVLFNAPVPCPDPAARALDMAADLHEALAAAKAEWQARGHAIGFGMGIAAGTATVGRIGYAGRLEYTAIGNVVNLAARLCARAEDGQTLVDRATADAVDRSGELTSLGRTALKGYAETVPIFLHRRPPGGSQLVERRPTRCPTPRSAAATAGVLRS